MDGAGCLVLLGLLLLLPVLMYSTVAAVEFVRNLVAAIRANGWSEIPRVLGDVWQWLLGRSAPGTFSPALVLFLTGFFLLNWQWTAFLLGWRPRLPSPRLWAVSSGYFVAAMIAFGLSTWPASNSVQAVKVDSEVFGVWLFSTLAFSVVAGGFLCVTLSLWVVSIRPRAKLAGSPSANSKVLPADDS